MKWQFSSLPLKLLIAALLVLTAQARPLIEDADYTDVDLVAEESRNCAYSSSSRSGSNGCDNGNPFGLSPDYFPSGPGAGFHNQPPYGFPPSNYYDQQSFGPPVGGHNHYPHGFPSEQLFNPYGFQTGSAYNPYSFSPGPPHGFMPDPSQQTGPGTRHPPRRNNNKKPMKETKGPAMPPPATKPPPAQQTQPEPTSVPQNPPLTTPIVEPTTPPASPASPEVPAEPNSTAEPVYDIDIRFGER